MMKAGLPDNERERLDALRHYHILDTIPERDFDDLALMASQICGTPMALISLIDADRQWFKAKVGLTVEQTSRDFAFCAHAILQHDLFVVPDAQADARFSTNPLVTSDPSIRFYAGAPLMTFDGYALGTLCVIDRVPRELSREQGETLQALSRQVVSQLELRRTTFDLARTTTESQAALAALRVSEEFKNRMIECSRDCLKVLDLEGRLLSMNAGGMEVLEICDLAPFISSSWIDFWQGEDRQAAQAAVETARQGGVGRFTGFFATTQTKTPKWWDVVVSPIRYADGRPEKLLAASQDVTEWKRAQTLLNAIIAGTSTVTGREFFRPLVQNLATGLGVRYSFVAECLPNERARSLAFWAGDKVGPDFEYDLRGTPCLKVSEGRTCLYDHNLQGLFPADEPLVEMSAESYLGVPLRDSTQTIIGHLVIIDDKPMARDPLVLSVMETFASRAGVELERMRAFDSLRRQHQESEERFRDLFDEAPIAYVNEGLDSHFIQANRAAIRILGIQPAEVAGTYGKDFVPETPDAQRRLREAFDSIGRGTDTSGVVLELRRRDDGKPIWIQWWSNPDPSGTYTRTMFVDITERVLMEREKARLEAQNTYLQEEIRNEHNFDEIVGSSPALLETLQKLERVAATDSTVLIHGETGTGKELIARAIHSRSARRKHALVKVNCGAISAGLVESELFGHLKGAFTGAIDRRVGRFELADGGTLFLDEVSELPLETQVKLLRVLQEGEFEPVGSSRAVRVDVRIIVATNRHLEEEVRAGRFRSDLFYRLNVFPLRVPPLRERRSDIPQLAMFFLSRFAKKFGQKMEAVSQETMEVLMNYPWPGNIRELQNIIERAAVLSQGPVLTLGRDLLPASASGDSLAAFSRPGGSSLPHSPAAVSTASQLTPQLPHTLEDVERHHILTVLEQTGWVVEGAKGAAKVLNLHPNTLRSRMKKLGIQRSSYGIS